MKRVGIIGGGVAGLTAGIYLLKSGIPCEIFEKNAMAGGNLTGWRREECVIDNCLHWLTGTRCGTALYALWQDIGMLDENTAIYRAPYFYRSELRGESVALYASMELARREFHAVAPADSREIDRFFDAAEALRDLTCRTGGVSLSIAKRLPTVIRYSCLSLGELAEHFHSPLLRRLITDYIGGDYTALGLLVPYAAFSAGNASLPQGGSPAAAERITERFVSLGGVLHTGCEVRRVVIGGREATGILTADSRYRAFDTVLCACDPEVTYGHLLTGAKRPRVLSEKKELRFSALHAAFSCDKLAISPFGTLVIDAPELQTYGASRLVVREFSHEPTFTPKGKQVVQCMLLQKECESKKWVAYRQDSSFYRRQKDRVGEKMADALLRRFPAAAQSLRLLDVWTPATYRRYFGAPSGAFMPWYMPPHALPCRLPYKVKPYRNVFLVTQWERSPGGLPGAAMAGKRAAERLLKGETVAEKLSIGESFAH
ncbi:MAG: NAD(P)/FAD-dependent oxidoreductase [Ruminococcaceae bacterium]|nr:NAD(P)/FAD-dependent oxidoreductase [Oscillospiraceae bacterium]